MNETPVPPKPTRLNVALAIMLIGVSVILLGIVSIGLLAPNIIANLATIVALLAIAALAFHQYLGTFRCRASSAQWTAGLTAMIGALLLFGFLGVRHLWQLGLVLTLVALLFSASRSNYLWFQKLERYRAAGGTWPHSVRFSLREFALLITLAAVVFGIHSYRVHQNHPSYGYRTTHLAPVEMGYEGATDVSYLHDYRYYRYDFTCSEEAFLEQAELYYQVEPINSPIQVEAITDQHSLRTITVTEGWHDPTLTKNTGSRLIYDRSTGRVYDWYKRH